MKRTIVLAGMLTLAGVARATVYYVSDCQAGADPINCLAGNDAYNGTDPSTPWQTMSHAFANFGSLNPGDQILFARGGSFVSADNQVYNHNSQATNPIVIDAYTPSWYSGNNKPILTYAMVNPPNGGRSMFRFEIPGNAHHTEGYVIRNLELHGSGAGWGIFFSNDVDNILMENLLIDGFAIGVGLEGGNTPDPGSNGLCDHVILRSSRMVNDTEMGFLGQGNDILIENNQFENNGTDGGIRNHNLYVGGVGDNIRVRGNDLYRASMSGGVCTGTSLVVHGLHNGLVIENNTVHEDVGAATGYCWGIGVTTGYTSAEGSPGAVIRGNRVINVGGNAISATSCPNCVIENNVVVQEQPIASDGIRIPDGTGHGTEDMADTNAIIRNNSVYFSAAVTQGTGISLGGVEGTGYVLVNNAVYYAGTAGGGNGVSGFGVNLATTSYTAVDNNIFSSPNSPNSLWEGTKFLALTQWRAATPFDVHSSTANPLFASPGTPNYDLSIPAGSPATDKGNIVYASTMDITGQKRDGFPDIGAYEYFAGGAVPPVAPTGLAATAVSSTTINLTWSAPAGTVTGYRIYRGSSLVGSSLATYYSDTGLTPSTAYTYSVYALNGSQISGPSNAASATTPAAPAGGGTGGGTTASSVTLLETAAFPNPAVGKDPTIRAFVGNADELEITIYDAAGSVVHTDRVAGGPTGTASNGKPYYDYVWTGKKASGVYYAVIHGKKGGDVVRARVKFAVVR
jgi:hypothetical protein